MDGEMLRDTALAASGLLVEKIGGPSVKPYQPAGVWEAGSHQGSDTKSYTQDHGESLYRRSLYTFLEKNGNDARYGHAGRAGARCRLHPPANAPTLRWQALVLMNDPQWLEAASPSGGAGDPAIVRDCSASQLPWRSAARPSVGST